MASTKLCELVIFVGRFVSLHNVASTLCDGSETQTEWKFKSISYLRTDEGTDGLACLITI